MRATLWRSTSRLATPVTAAAQHHDERPVLHLRVEHAGVAGIGEVSPQPTPLNGDPGLDEVVEQFAGTLMSRLERLVEREGEPPAWSRASGLVSELPASRVGGALLEMALLERELRFRGDSIETLWPAQFATPLQQTVSLIDDVAPWRVEPAAARVRVKTAPGALSEAGLARLGELAVPVLLDFNASASGPDEVLEQVRAVGAVARLDAVEQPFAPGNVVETARLAARLDVDLSLDEGVRDEGDLAQIVRYGAARVLCVKPARVGGYARARSLIGRASDLGLRVYLGGFFETALARGLNRAFAATCVAEPSDVGEVALAGPPTASGPDAVPDGAVVLAEWS